MTTATRSIVVISAGLSSPSSTRMLADQLAEAARAELSASSGDVQVRVHELREHATDIMNALTSRFASGTLQAIVDQIRAADAVIAVTPIFNMGPSGLFKTFLDGIDREVWRNKPVLLGATAGTARHSLALDLVVRPSFEYVKASIVPTLVFAASSDFGAASASEADDTPLTERARRAARELSVMLTADGSGSSARTHETPETAQDIEGEAVASGLDPEFADFTPMDQLLGGR